ncbi:unnamed protein product [Acanthoscelides obtectus]|uniref:Tc1-like transposase DDE domain-containing protein n=1 Tax=Acanthoscelides obtectus TaxID=200917 RepID=A0A9P0JMS4_ACAOB|nr:unnamed protein product [Acanthoscelides obtectus]CAK1672923.1 Mariner Mos1 transposase [Acanthoscelides obtectus]
MLNRLRVSIEDEARSGRPSSSRTDEDIDRIWDQCFAELLSVFGNEAPHHLSDDPRVSAPKTAVTQENVDAVRKLIIEDRHASLKISKTSIQKILHEELGVGKLVSRWIPHLLTEEQKAARVNCGDESWIYCYEPENKRQSAVCVFQGEEKPTKMVATFVSKAGHIATIPLNEQRTVTANWYTTICLSKVITELRKINPGRRIILHQDNASSHTAQKTRQYLTEENVELLDHPPYSPDLSPNDFFTFSKIKNSLGEEAVDALKNAVLDLPANEWNKCFENWFERIQLSQQECLAELLSSGDESWIYCYEPENKRQSAVWVFQGEEKPSAVIRSRSVSKKMVATFVSKAGHIATIPLNEQITVIADWYTTICLPKVITEVRKINPERRIPPRQCKLAHSPKNKTVFNGRKRGISPDLSPSDFFTFPKINRLRGQRFPSPEEAVDAFKNAVLDLPANEWNKCFEN